jgi:hypothetical protein
LHAVDDIGRVFRSADDIGRIFRRADDTAGVSGDG